MLTSDEDETLRTRLMTEERNLKAPGISHRKNWKCKRPPPGGNKPEAT